MEEDLINQYRIFHTLFKTEMDKSFGHKDYDIKQNNYHLLTKRGKYLSGISSLSARMVEAISDLDKVLVFIRRYPDAKYLNINRIDNIDYIKYHLEVLTHKIHTILEIMKLMINEVYELSISERDCSWDNLKIRKELENTDVLKLLELYHKTFKGLIEARHLNTHRATDIDPVTNNMKSTLSLLRMDYEYSNLLNQETLNKFTPFLLRHEIKEYRKERVSYVKSVKDGVKYYTDIFKNIVLKEANRRALQKDE